MNSNYSNYFEYRGISAATYYDHTLPKYFIDIMGLNFNISILDFGCGFGQNLKALSNIGFNNSKGYDIEPNAIRFCQENNISVIDGSEIEISEISEKFDFIIATHVLEHIPKHLIIQTLRKLRHLLNTGGRLFVAVPNAQSNTGCYWRYEDFTHHTMFTAGSLLYVLKEAGFTEVFLCDKDCLSGLSFIRKIIKLFFLKIYRLKNNFWNSVTSSSYHQPSPVVNSYEIKMVATQQ